MTSRSRTFASTMLTGATALIAASACSTGADSPATGGAGSSTATTAPRTGAAYRDGDYTATGIYGNDSRITVALTLDDGVIDNVSVTPHATNPTSRDLQERFADAVPQAVEGKPIDEVELTYLAGSSGTTQGFNDALNKIKERAAG